LPRVWRYIVASVVATAVTELCYLALYATDMSTSTLAGVVAFLAGALPKFVLLRWWVWRLSGTPRVVGEVLPYVAIAGGTGLVAGGVTGFAETAIEDQVASRTLEVLFVGGAFLAVMGAVAALRYVLFDLLVFNEPRRSAPSRRSGA
jgi:putative flippase GtrA